MEVDTYKRETNYATGETGETGDTHHYQMVPDSPTAPQASLRSSGRFVDLVEVWEAVEPPPREFFVEGLIPAGFCTQLYGAGGTGKSYLAAHLGMSIVLGKDYGDRKVKQSNVVYVDGELDADEFVRRAYMLARGMGLTRPPEGLYYYKLDGPITDREVQKNLEYALQVSGAKFFILDSMTISTYAADPTSAPDVIAIVKYLESLGTWLFLDHIPKPKADANQGHQTPFGSVFKTNTSRSSIQLMKADGGGSSLVHRKTNFSALQPALHLNLIFNSNDVQVRFVEANDPTMDGIEQHLGATEQVYLAVAGLGRDGGTSVDIGQALDQSGTMMALKTVQNHLTKLHKEGRIVHHPMALNRWVACSRFPEDQAVPALEGIDIGKSPF
jgi:hypothetical protein